MHAHISTQLQANTYNACHPNFIPLLSEVRPLAGCHTAFTVCAGQASSAVLAALSHPVAPPPDVCLSYA